MNHQREAEHSPALLLRAASSREGGCVSLQPHTAIPLSSPEEQAIAFTPAGASIASAKSLGKAVCTQAT